MGLARTITAAMSGVTGHLVEVEANVGPGLPGTYIVGMGDTAIAEAKDRMKAAASNSRLRWPKTKVVVSLSPASLPKSGAHLDLAMAIAILAAGDPEAPNRRRLDGTIFLGEVGLDGTLKPTPGILPALLAAQRGGVPQAVIPPENAAEAALVDGMEVLAAPSLGAAYSWLCGECELEEADASFEVGDAETGDFRDVVGQPEAKFAAEVAAAGGHHFMMIGPPGSGKSMIAARLPGILPPLEPQERLEATTVHSVAGKSYTGAISRAPFVAPHHSVTRAALLGGGSGNPRPGAVSLAHGGVLFLDEVQEIPARVLDSLRIPLEQGSVRLVRARRDVIFPARFQLVLAANPCRCGAEEATQCRCSSAARANYLSNISGPLRDRIDIMVNTRAKGPLLSGEISDSSEAIAQRVLTARSRARRRWEAAGFGAICNAWMDPSKMRREFPASEDGMALLEVYLGEGTVSQRGVDRALKLSWTLADLEGAARPSLDHVARALDLRAGDQR